MHNWPGLPVGQFAIRPGPMMAAFDIFEIDDQRPRRACRDAASRRRSDRRRCADRQRSADDRQPQCRTRSKARSSASRRSMAATPGTSSPKRWCCAARPARSTPQCAIGSSRRSAASPRALCRAAGREMTTALRAALSADRQSRARNRDRRRAAAALVGEDNVRRDLLPSMAAEDFACFLEKKPGAYIWIGNGDAAERRDAAQSALRLQRRHIAVGRELLGAPCRNCAGEGKHTDRIVTRDA